MGGVIAHGFRNDYIEKNLVVNKFLPVNFYFKQNIHQALQNKTPDEVYETAAGGGALIVQKYKTECEKSDEIAPAVDNCPAHRTPVFDS